MYFVSRWAIFWILVSYTVADSIRNVDENTTGARTSRLVFPTKSEAHENRARQRRHNVIDAAKRKNLTEDAQNSKNLIEDIVRQTQHPIKKQIKFKRLRYLSSDQNDTKLFNDKPKDDTKDFIKLRFTDSDSFRNASASKIRPDATDNDAGDRIPDAVAGPVVARVTQPHRKKRRRLIAHTSPPSSTAASAARYLSPYETYVSRDHVIPFLDFGKKISAPSPDGARQWPQRASEYDAAVDGKASQKGDRPSDGVSPESYAKPTNKATSANATNTPMCANNQRAVRAGVKNSKREISPNGTQCRPNATERSPERASRPRVEHKTRADVGHGPGGGDVAEGNRNQKKSPLAATTVATQLTTRILSTAVITSVSMKTNDLRPKFKSTTTMSTAPVNSNGHRKHNNVEYAPETYKRPRPSSPFETYLSDVMFASAAPATSRPSLTPYYRTGNSSTKNYRNSSNMRSSKLSLPTAGRSGNATLATSEATTTSANAFKPVVEYLMNLTTSSRLEIEPSVTTATSFVRNASATTVTKDDAKEDSTSAAVFVTYEGVERDTENWVYHVRTNNKTTSENSTTHPKVYTIFSRNGGLSNHSSRNQQSLNAVLPDKESVEGDFDDGGHTGFHIVTYVLAGLGVIPLVIGIALVTKMILSQNKKQIFEGSEYSSEYNRNPLEFSAGVTSSPIATKLPRVAHQANWEIEKKSAPSITIPNNSQWEFPRSKLRLQTILGQGNFGQVWKAEADDINGHEGLTRLVAVKMVKEISSTREKEDLIKELMIMQHLGSHPNVVTLLGCCTEKEPYMLIMEYVMYGKLLSFLRDHRTRTHYFNFSDNGDTLTSRDLTVFAYCVARGMEYLQNKQVIHRDLAARNILIDHNKLCKIADFGMSRCVEESGQVYEHRQSKGALPIRWMAPESLHYSCYTHKTDVWSFGILMWEIVTLGSMPYASMGARVVMRKVKEGYRLEKPKYCKSPLFNVISKCWNSDPNRRPTFTELKQELYNLLEDPEHLGNYVDLEGLAEEVHQVIHGSHNEKFII